MPIRPDPKVSAQCLGCRLKSYNYRFVRGRTRLNRPFRPRAPGAIKSVHLVHRSERPSGTYHAEPINRPRQRACDRLGSRGRAFAVTDLYAYTTIVLLCHSPHSSYAHDFATDHERQTVVANGHGADIRAISRQATRRVRRFALLCIVRTVLLPNSRKKEFFIVDPQMLSHNPGSRCTAKSNGAKAPYTEMYLRV